jgi:hypothetical protein
MTAINYKRSKYHCMLKFWWGNDCDKSI